MQNAHQVFIERLDRIAKHEGNTNATLHIGTGEALEKAAFYKPKKIRSKMRRQTALLMPVALIIGALAWAWAHWARTMLLEGLDTSRALAAEVAITLVIMVCLRLAIGLRGMPSLLMQLVGGGAGFLLLHNAVHLWPDLFAQVFPSEWVNLVISTTQPMSVAFNIHML